MQFCSLWSLCKFCRRPAITTFYSLFALKVTQIDLRACCLRTAGSAIFASNVFSCKAMRVPFYNNVVLEYLSTNNFFILARGWYEWRFGSSRFCVISHTSLQLARSKKTAHKYLEIFKQYDNMMGYSFFLSPKCCRGLHVIFSKHLYV